jgi:large subunit ribosomal protein L18
MKVAIKRREARARRKKSIRKKVNGTTARPRLAVFRSLQHIYAQVIDDVQGHTLASASTLDKELRGQLSESDKSDAARKVGQLVAQRCLSQDIKQVVFDRGGNIYHGRIKALADGAREGGLDF